MRRSTLVNAAALSIGSAAQSQAFLGALLLTWLIPLALDAEEAPYALRITPENAAERQLHGPDSTAGIDDWVVGNGTLCAAVTDPSHESDLSDLGAALVDVGHCDRKDDQWGSFQPILNFSQSTVVPVSEVETETGEGVALIRTRGTRDGVVIETSYSVNLETPHALGITTRITRTEDGPSFFSHGAVLLHPTPL